MARFSRAALLAAALGVVGVSASTEAALTPDHFYELQGTLNDYYGGPALVKTNYTGQTATGYGDFSGSGFAFGDSRGLSLATSALTNTQTYSIVLDFRFNDTVGYQKVIDFKAADQGLYVVDSDLNLYNTVIAAPATNNAFTANVMHRLVLTRDGATDRVRGYVDGVLQFDGLDTFDVSVATSRLLFFQDDSSGNTNEAEPGFVERIAIFNRALTQTEAQDLRGTAVAVPEPAAGALVAAGAALLLGRRRRRA